MAPRDVVEPQTSNGAVEPETRPEREREKTRVPAVGLNLLRSMAEHGPGRVTEIDGEIAEKVADVLRLANEKARIEVALLLVGDGGRKS